LNKGEWGAIPLPVPPATPATSSRLLELSGPQLWKWTLLSGIHSLLVAFGFGPDRAVADAAWDNAQRKLHLTTALALLSNDADLRAAAERVRAHFLLGDGLAQTNLAYQAEVDFGFKQIALGRGKVFQDDLKRLDAAPIIDEVESTTLALARAIGHTAGEGAGPARTQREGQRRAMAACQRACNATLAQIDLLLTLPISDADQKHLEALRQPLTDLLDRYPRSAADPADASSDA
jgi:hypothetical protein